MDWKLVERRSFYGVVMENPDGGELTTVCTSKWETVERELRHALALDHADPTYTNLELARCLEEPHSVLVFQEGALTHEIYVIDFLTVDLPGVGPRPGKELFQDEAALQLVVDSPTRIPTTVDWASLQAAAGPLRAPLLAWGEACWTPVEDAKPPAAARRRKTLADDALLPLVVDGHVIAYGVTLDLQGSFELTPGDPTD